MSPSPRESTFAESRAVVQKETDLPWIFYWSVLAKRIRLIGLLVGSSIGLALLISAFLPKIYGSTATLLPQVNSRGAGGLAALLGASEAGSAAQGLGIALPGLPATPTDLFVAMLKSRIMADDVIKQFNLMDYYGVKIMQDARKALENDTKITVSKDKVIKIAVEAKSPNLAADIANFYIANLDRLNRTLNVTKASQNRAFIEHRLEETKANLVRTEETLREFKTKNMTVEVEAQAKAMLQAAGAIQGQISAQEVQLQVMSSYMSPGNPELSRVRSQVDELRNQLYLIESGKNGKGMLPGDRFHPAMTTAPSLALEYGRLLRTMKVQETVYNLLISQLEQAKIAEARDTPTVQVLDPAIPAETPSRPKIWLNVVTAAVLSLFMSIFLVFFLEYLERVRSQRPAVQAMGNRL
jgi:tyrosine-protein kinase Etk/Wzc